MSIRATQMETDPFRALMRRIDELAAEVRELRAGRRLESASIGRGGVTVREGGTVRVYDPDGRRIAQLGDLSDFIEGYRGVWLGRANGQPAFIASGTGDNGEAGYAAMYDPAGNYIVSDDVIAGRGLGRPYIPLPLGEVSPPTATTTSGSFTDLATGVFPMQHKGLYAYLLVRASDATTAGEARVAIDGTQRGSTLPITAGSYAFASIGPFATELTDEYGSFHGVSVQARRTAGTGTIGVRVLSMIGLDSAWV
ncbi:hypothetical protein FXF53_20500 [Micromonospora sp. WP24]|uniref:hypothetical protein n=1 Tax=Micromonospora sp. WP24 TaxID=2604469 RepID=UPI0011D432D3|nr:hypothetical protein [Micromonospora sp. WP24]TYB97127.1 hypothetical protein FXF53_20500 [Micromonospora sp. WP24]